MLHKGENLLCFSSQHSAFSTSLLTLRALPLWSPNVCEFFSHTKRFSGISGCPLQFIQFWHSLRRDNIRSHTWRVQSPTSNANCKSRLLPVLVTNRLQIRGSHDPSLGSSNLLEWLRTQKTVYLLLTSLLEKNTSIKGTDEHADGMFIEQVIWERLWHYLLWAPLSRHLHVFTPEALQPLYVWDFCGSLIP